MNSGDNTDAASISDASSMASGRKPSTDTLSRFTMGAAAIMSKPGSTPATLPRAAGAGANAGNQAEEPAFSLQQEDYELGNVIGFGSSAVVYIATYKPLMRPVAIKMIDLDLFERNQIDELRKELQVMNLCKHPNLLNVKGSFVVGAKLYIITPFLNVGSCLDVMKTAYPDGLEEAAIALILKQALQGLDYLHKNGLIHRDVKAGNLLMDDDGSVKLADFGVSSSLYESGDRRGMRKTFVGTPCWIAPEVVQQTGHDGKADIWSFGITSLELAHGRAPFAKYPPMKVLLMTLQNDPPTLDRATAKRKFSKSFKDMIDTCLQKDPTKRPSAEKLLQHSFFKSTKKKQYLVDTIIKTLPPVQDRPHKEPMRQEPDYVAGQSWDFPADPPSLDPDEVMSQVSAESPIGSDESIEGFPFEQKASTTQQKKGRFVVDVTTNPEPSNKTLAHSRSASLGALSGVTTVSASMGQPSSSAGNTEVRKGRFSVFEGSTSRGEDGKPRIENPAAAATGAPSSGEPKVKRFVVVENSGTAPANPPPSTAIWPEGLRKGRFEVTSSSPSDNASVASSQSDPTSVPAVSPLTIATNPAPASRGHVRFGSVTSIPLSEPGTPLDPKSTLPLATMANDTQRIMVTEWMNRLNIAPSDSRSDPTVQDLLAVINGLNGHVQQLYRENEALRRENAALKNSKTQ